jgi:hypothetical protein
VVIVGGGFGGLAAAKALGKAPVEVILIDRTNHHVFQPLLYQVATSVLAPSQMSSPIREVLRRHKNTTVIMGEVTGVDKAQRCVFVNDADREHVPVHYDYLILATGVRHSYFGHNEFEKFAPGLKSLADAVAIRNKILSAFEQAEAEEDLDLHRDLLTFVLVGAGPTGVEMAAALAVFVRTTLRSDFRRIDPTSARIVLIDAARKVLGTFAPSLSDAAEEHLQKLGVEIHLGQAIFISNRSFDRALDLATRCGGEAVCFGYCLFEMRDVDVVIAATSSAETLLSCDDIENLMKARRNRPLLLIDLSVPRNIDPAVTGLDNVSLYNIDDLEALSRQGAQARERELATCHQIIEAHVAALIKKLESESERMTRTDLFRRSLEATRDISYPLPTTSGLVAQPS